MALRCFSCGSSYDTPVKFCWVCLSDHSVHQAPRRQPSRLAGSLQGASARALAAAAWDTQTSPAYPNLTLLSGAMVCVAGPPGDGKSTFVLRLLDGLPCPVALLSLEEGVGPTLQARLARLGIRRKDLFVYSQAGVDQLVEELRQRKVQALGIDSVSVSQLVPGDVRQMQRAARLKLALVVQQVAKDGRPAGLNAWQHESDVNVTLKDMSWRLTKSRYGPLTEGKVLECMEEYRSPA